MNFPRAREYSFPSTSPRSLYESDAILHLSQTRWFLLTFGCVLPEISGAIIVFKIYPWVSVLLFAAALSTIAFIATYLRRQPCFIRVFSEVIVIETRRNRQTLKRQEILECELGNQKNIILKHRDETQVIEFSDARAFQSAFRQMKG